MAWEIIGICCRREFVEFDTCTTIYVELIILLMIIRPSSHQMVFSSSDPPPSAMPCHPNTGQMLCTHEREKAAMQLVVWQPQTAPNAVDAILERLGLVRYWLY